MPTPTKTESQYEAQIAKYLRDSAGIIGEPDFEDLVKRANEVYSRKKPVEIVVDLPGDGTGKFLVSDLEGFDEDFSGDPQIEFPISTEGEEKIIDRRFWKFYRTPDGLEIRLLDNKPSASEMVRFTFKTKHAIGEEGSTVFTNDFYAFCRLGAAEGFDDMSAYFKQTSDNQITDGVPTTYQTVDDKYAKAARDMRKLANEHFGIKADDSTPAASVTKNWDTTNSLGGDRLTHPRRRR
jgi:hypothetical protein